jgi:hypothetical protein
VSSTARIARGIKDVDTLLAEFEATLSKEQVKPFRQLRAAIEELADEACESTGITLDQARRDW